MSQTVLIVEDDPKTRDILQLYLEGAGYEVLMAADGREGLEKAREHRPDLIVLDIMLPEIDGLHICRTLRRESETPIIMLTARSTEDDMLLGLDLGADDYITKPFSPREVVARVRTVLRRVSKAKAQQDVEVLTHGELEIDKRRHEVRVNGEAVKLTPKEFQLLLTMALSPGRAFTRDELVEQAFGYDYDGLERTVDAHIMNLRKKIEPDPSDPTYIETVYGIGYRFAELNNVQ